MLASVPVSHYLEQRHEHVVQLLARYEVMHYLNWYKWCLPLSALARKQSCWREVIVSPIAILLNRKPFYQVVWMCLFIMGSRWEKLHLREPHGSARTLRVTWVVKKQTEYLGKRGKRKTKIDLTKHWVFNTFSAWKHLPHSRSTCPLKVKTLHVWGATDVWGSASLSATEGIFMCSYHLPQSSLLILDNLPQSGSTGGAKMTPWPVRARVERGPLILL